MGSRSPLSGFLHRRGRRRGCEGPPILQLKQLMNTRLHYSQIFFIRMKPFLIRIFERCREGRHDLSAVTKVTANLSPFLLFADALKAASRLDSLLQLEEVERALVHTREASQTVTVLLVEFGKLV